MKNLKFRFALVLILFYSNPASSHPFDFIELDENDPYVKNQFLENNLVQGEIDPTRLGKHLPFAGSPVHENLTSASITLSKIYNRNYKYENDSAYIHGVFWNDDPEDMLCPECSVFNLLQFDERWGLKFVKAFYNAKDLAAQSENVPPFNVGDKLLARSHFGDLQFLHAMASKSGEKSSDTLSKIMAWAEFTYKVSISDISPEIRLIDIPINTIRDLFKSDSKLSQYTIKKLFANRENTQDIALGSLMHMIQDSYFEGHVKRIKNDTFLGRPFARGAIQEFHSYVGQSEKKHKAADRWPQSLSISSPAGKENPIYICSELLKFRKAKRDWKFVEGYLLSTVFKTTTDISDSSPGDAFKDTNIYK